MVSSRAGAPAIRTRAASVAGIPGRIGSSTKGMNGAERWHIQSEEPDEPGPGDDFNGFYRFCRFRRIRPSGSGRA